MGRFTAENHNDANGKPAGGYVDGIGFRIDWQDGPLFNTETGERREQSGAFVEDVIAAVVQRMQYFQEGEFRCRENALVITKLEEALHWLEARTRDREARGVEGTHIP